VATQADALERKRETQTFVHFPELHVREPPNALCKKSAIERDDLGNVDHGVSAQPD